MRLFAVQSLKRSRKALSVVGRPCAPMSDVSLVHEAETLVHKL